MGGFLTTIRSHPWRTLSVSLLVVLAAGAFMSRDVIRLAVTPEEPIDYTLPLAPTLNAGAGEVVYRIDADRSEVVVGVEEQLAGVRGDVELRTQGIAGDIAIAAGAPPQVRLGDVVVDVHQLQSDNSLRDKVLRHEYLESHSHRQIRLEDAEVTLPGDATADAVEGATIDATLVVKGEPHPVSWNVDARVNDDTLTATATTSLKMSDLGVGPITKVGLVQSSDDVELTLRLVAVDGRSFTPPMGLSYDRVESLAAGSAPSFATDVQPILEANCATCHNTGSIGAAMWTLDEADDAVEVADGLAVVTGAGYMPPWPASDQSVPFRHSRGLSEAEIATISEWASSGAELDVPGRTPVEAPAEPEVEPPRADKVITLAEPYQGSTEKRNDYRCFILDPELTEPTFLTGYTFDPDRVEVVHHAIVYRVTADKVAATREKDAADDGSGWSCFAGMSGDSGQRIAGWVPGQRPVKFGPGDGFEMGPGDVLVAQIHYHFATDAPLDRSGMTLEFAEDPTGIVGLQSRTLIGPVELPCPPGSTAPLCDRDASLADVGERFGPAGAAIANGLHRACGTTVEEVAARSDGYTATTTCDFPVRSGGDVIGVLGHMHELGASYRLTLNPDTPEEQILLDIPTWNFEWQLSYSPVEDVVIEPEDTFRVTCTWDRRLRHETEPRWVVFAEGTEDEMCFSTITVRPSAPAG
jgi:polyisoprenoid-binding protein YceI